jgi:polynucleotide 5'-kinase involved in rRNA processing
MTSPHPDFAGILKAVRAARQGPVLVLGAVDTGKTTLLRHLASALAARRPVWVVSADAGQAWIGPPTTLARALLLRPPCRWSRLRPERLAFLGATSPAPCLALEAALLVRLATEGIPPGQRVLVDTPGLVTGPPAMELWRRVAKDLRPALVVAIERENELAPVLRPLCAAGARIVTIAPDTRVRARGRNTRTAYREAAFRRYFARAARCWLEAPRVGVVLALTGEPACLDLNRLVSLRDRSGRDLALGLVRSVGPRRIGLLTPLKRPSAVAALATGAIRLDPRTGAEIAPRQPV